MLLSNSTRSFVCLGLGQPRARDPWLFMWMSALLTTADLFPFDLSSRTTVLFNYMASREPLLSNTIVFPARSSHENSPNLSMVSTRATALDVCYSVYGDSPLSPDTVDKFYETNASDYENPFITATSRSVISDIHRVSRQLSSVDVPRPLAVICTLFRLRPPSSAQSSLFQAMRVWTDVGDICENESFDGHRKAIVEHTLNILLLPGIHCEGPISHARGSTDSLVNTHGSPMIPSHPHIFTTPSLPVPGTSLSIPSPLHFQLRIITRLSFNEQGLVAHHRDFWDVKDVMGLVPGVSLAQWIGTRVAAAGLSYVSRFLPKGRTSSHAESPSSNSLETTHKHDKSNGFQGAANRLNQIRGAELPQRNASSSGKLPVQPRIA
ncbi:hypothetical protein B0H34DRAFT_690171 [Crassisporium funariophilum]|nr:hypothetical protein B0H34DRAFT_690171 [Crassisporium funariophilum]